MKTCLFKVFFRDFRHPVFTFRFEAQANSA